MDLQNQTKKELIKYAKQFGITGAYDMNKKTLIEVIELCIKEKEEAAAKERMESGESAHERDPKTGLVIRKGKNLSGNIPWKCKYYMVDTTKERDLSKLAPQARNIIEFMIDAEVTDVENCAIGEHIVDGMKESGYITTPIPSANLFAYYRSKMEKFGGLVHVQ